MQEDGGFSTLGAVQLPPPGCGAEGKSEASGTGPMHSGN